MYFTELSAKRLFRLSSNIIQMLNLNLVKHLKLTPLLFAVVILFAACKKEINKKEENNEAIFSTEDYIVGFAGCNLQTSSPIGYFIISTDPKDTLLTYNINDKAHKTPAYIVVGSDTLFEFPESHLSYETAPYFPETARYKHKVKITYTEIEEKDYLYFACATSDAVWPLLII